MTQDLRTFQPFFRSTTGMDGRMSALFLYPNVFNLPAIRFFPGDRSRGMTRPFSDDGPGPPLPLPKFPSPAIPPAR